MAFRWPGNGKKALTEFHMIHYDAEIQGYFLEKRSRIGSDTCHNGRPGRVRGLSSVKNQPPDTPRYIAAEIIRR